MEAKKILLVEDSREEAELTICALNEHHLAGEVVAVHDGFDALDYLRRTGGFAGRPDGDPLVMLLDLRMPRMDGLEVLRHIRDDPRLCTLPVVVLTGSRESRDVAEAYRLGVQAYIVKPAEFERLVDVVKGIGLLWLLLEPETEQALAS